MKRSLPFLLAIALLSAAAGGGESPAADPKTGESSSAHLEGIDPETVDWKSKDAAWWESVLTPTQFAVCREGGTERAFTGTYNAYKKDGVYHCSSCGAPLFDADSKFDSGTGWPSFTEPVAPDAVELRRDFSFGMFRTEVVCARCGAHLGHVFDDGPEPTGKRYCINSVCLLHRAEGSGDGPAPPSDGE